MAKVLSTSKITTEIVFQVNESEARAVSALASYDAEGLAKIISTSLGRGFYNDHGIALASFFDTVRAQIRPHLKDVDDARKLLQEAKYNRERGIQPQATINATP